MICCADQIIVVNPEPSCSTEMVVTATTNATQESPAISGVPAWNFGSRIASGFPTPTFGSITLTFHSPTLKTWRFGGGKFNPGVSIANGWQLLAFPVAPTITIDGVPVTLVNTVVDGTNFWLIDGSDTFTTDACVDVVVVASGTSAYGGLGDNACLIQIEDTTP